MKAFWQIVKLELLANIRSRAFAFLAIIASAWMIALPYFIASDGTQDGAHNIYVRYGFGAVFAMLAICLCASGAGSIAKDREAKRLQLTLVKPVRLFAIALARTFALTFIGACVLFIASVCSLFVLNPSRSAFHIVSPIMESVREEAEKMYSAFIADPSTPKEVKLAKKDVVIRLLTQKAYDHYQTIATNDVAMWQFGKVSRDSRELAIRMRFTNMFETRDFVVGDFTLGDCKASISNVTQAVMMIPLAMTNDDVAKACNGDGFLKFKNNGKNSLMLRPRRDIQLLAKSSTSVLAMNLFFANVEMICLLATMIAFAMFLSSSLGRSVAIFTVLAMMFVSSVSPAVLEQYPDQLEKDRRDRIGLVLTRSIKTISSPVSSFHPISSLTEDEMIELSNVGEAIILDLIVLPLFFSLIAGFVLPRKTQS